MTKISLSISLLKNMTLYKYYGSRLFIFLFVVYILRLGFQILYFPDTIKNYLNQVPVLSNNNHHMFNVRVNNMLNGSNKIDYSKIRHGKLCFRKKKTKQTLFSYKFTRNINITKFKYHPNIPIFLYNPGNISIFIPDVDRIRWTGVIWQESWKKYPKFFLYSAHFDTREQISNSSNPDFNVYVRVLALYDGDKIPITYSCQFWFNQEDIPVITVIHRYDIFDQMGFTPQHLIPYVITCKVPQIDNHLRAPIAISIVNNTCLYPSNILQVTGQPPEANSASKSSSFRKKLSIGICGPALYYYSQDFSHRLIEWFEIMHLIGASKIILYKTIVHENIEKVLKYYEDIGRLIIVSFHYPPPYPDNPLLRRIWTYTQKRDIYALENIYFTDCILRFKDDFDYLAHFDPDEIPVLKKHKSLEELITYLRSKGSKDKVPAFYFLKWKTFWPETPSGKFVLNISKRFYILRHNVRPKTLVTWLDKLGKSIYDTNLVLAAFSHTPLLYVNKKNKLQMKGIVNPKIAYTAHFRNSKCGLSCTNISYTEETFLLPYKEKVIKEVDLVLKKLNLNIYD